MASKITVISLTWKKRLTNFQNDCGIFNSNYLGIMVWDRMVSLIIIIMAAKVPSPFVISVVIQLLLMACFVIDICLILQTQQRSRRPMAPQVLVWNLLMVTEPAVNMVLLVMVTFSGWNTTQKSPHQHTGQPWWWTAPCSPDTAKADALRPSSSK